MKMETKIILNKENTNRNNYENNKENKLIYMLAYPSREARGKAWKAFIADPDWKKAYKESTREGKLVKRVVNDFLAGTDFSKIK